MNRPLFLLSVAVSVAGMFFLANGGWPPKAKALDAPLGVLQGGSADDMIECGTTPTKVWPATATSTAKSILLIPESGGTVYIGGASVDATGGISVCSSGCDRTEFPVDGKAFYCLAVSTAVDVKILWGS